MNERVAKLFAERMESEIRKKARAAIRDYLGEDSHMAADVLRTLENLYVLGYLQGVEDRVKGE